MKVSIDATSIFKRIVAHPETFRAIEAELHKAANNLVATQLKKTASVDQLVAIERALGIDDLRLILETLPDAAIKTMSKKIDPHHPEIKTGSVPQLRTHLAALASGATTKSNKPVKATTEKGTSKRRAAKPEKTKEPAAWPQSMVEVAERKRQPGS